MAACPLLDNLFNWAAQQPAENETSVHCNLTTNQSAAFQGHGENVVTYAEGGLGYHPGGWVNVGRFGIFIPASFSGSLTQYYSDKRYGPQGSFTNYPFSASETTPLNITISGPPLLLGGSYSVSISSPGWGATQSFTPQCEAGLVYGTFLNAVLLVISLCEQISEPPTQTQ